MISFIQKFKKYQIVPILLRDAHLGGKNINKKTLKIPKIRIIGPRREDIIGKGFRECS